MRPIPTKLKDDAIVEAVCQLQFRTEDVPELVIGRLTLETKWRAFKPNRLPAADIPTPVRNATPILRTEPTFELRSSDGTRVVRLNENLVSYHIVGVKQYSGWRQFRPELEETAKAIFDQLKSPEISKLTLRYINAIHPERHFIKVVHDLALEVTVGGSKVFGPLNVNFVEQDGPDHRTTTRIAHPEFVQGVLPDGTCAVVDVEVTSPPHFSAKELGKVMSWIEAAHTYEKAAFFKLIPSPVLSRLTEE